MALLIIKNILTKRVRASSVMEPVIAMVVLVIVFGIAIGTFSRVFHSGINFRNLKARSELRKWTERVKSDHAFYDEIVIVNGFQLEKKLSTTTDKKFLILYVTAKDEEGLLLSEMKELILYPGNE